jgi:anti-sigma factor RsiW
LDEATLQSYYDGELAPHLMESATSHLASCVTCAAAARELSEETALLKSVLAADFEVNVPTHALRERIEAAVYAERIANAGRSEKAGLFASLASVFSFNSQRTLGYASLVAALAFAAIFGIVKFRQAGVEPPVVNNAANKQEQIASITTPPAASPNKINSIDNPVPGPAPVIAERPRIQRVAFTYSSPKPPAKAPVKLLPGERSYLQAIARLDSTINENKAAMRPSLQVEYERNLAVVDRAIAATRNAAKDNPNDPDAADFMFAAYQSKVDLLNTIADARLTGGRGH